ncbi:BACON domain-containing protein [Prevotella sp.]|uniref:BACON domain-containing protein n=1 Tax=Prevotella sp. TaxID=59823 RepID=UPI002F95D824
MKKIFCSLILCLGIAGLSACSDDNSKNLNWQSPISIINSNIIFEGNKASGGLRVQAPSAITATVTAPWCHISVVNGDSVTVNVDENATIEGRSAVIAIKSGDEELTAVVQQKGLSFLPKMDKKLTLTSDKGVTKYYIKHTTAAKAWSNVAWLKPSMDGDSLVIASDENTGMAHRSGMVYVQSGPYTDSVAVEQAFSFDKAYLRKYNLRYPSGSDWKSTPVEMVKNEDGYYFLKFTDAANSTFSGLEIPLEVDNVNMSIAIANLALAGTKIYKGTEYKVMVMVMGQKKGATSISRFSNGGIKLNGVPTVNNDKVTWNFTPNDQFNSERYDYLLRLSLSTDGSYSGYAKVSIATLGQPYLEQAD